MAQLTPEQLKALRAVPVNERTPNRVRVAMAIAAVKNEQIISATGIDKHQLSRIVHGRITNMELATVQPLAVFFGCDVNDLFPPQVAA